MSKANDAFQQNQGARDICAALLRELKEHGELKSRSDDTINALVHEINTRLKKVGVDH